MRVIVALFFLFISFSFLEAQQSGYLGKTYGIQYSLATSPSLSAGFIGNTQTPISIMHDFLIEKSISEDRTIGLSYRRNNVFVPAKTKDGGLNISNERTNSYSTYEAKSDFLITHNTFLITYGLYNGKANIAPFGRYINLSFGPTFYSLSQQNSELYFEYDSSSYNYGQEKSIYKFSDPNQYISFIFSLDYGFKRILSNNIYLTGSVGCNLFVNYFLPLGGFSQDNDNFELPADEYIMRTGRLYYQWQHLVEAKLGIGYFLF